MMAHDDNDPNDSASCTIMIVRSRRYKFCIEASDILSIGVRSERKFVRSRSRSEHRVRTTGIVVAQRIAAGRENVSSGQGKTISRTKSTLPPARVYLCSGQRTKEREVTVTSLVHTTANLVHCERGFRNSVVGMPSRRV